MNVELFPSFSVLIVDDEEYVLNSLSGVLESGGITNIICTRDSREVLDLLSGREERRELILLQKECNFSFTTIFCI